jgi:hypothetical protein
MKTTVDSIKNSCHLMAMRLASNLNKIGFLWFLSTTATVAIFKFSTKECD